MRIMEITITEIIKRGCIRLISLILITIPLFACYPILTLLGFSEKISTFSTVCLSVVVYFSTIKWVEPFLQPFLRRTMALHVIPSILFAIILLLRCLPFSDLNVRERLEENRYKRSNTERQSVE